MQQPLLLPDSAKDWVYISIAIGGVIFTAWRAHRIVVEKVNGVGERVNAVTTSCTQLDTKVDGVVREQETSRRDRSLIHERLGRVEQQNDGLSEHLTQLKIDIIGHVDEVKHLVQDKDTRLRERIIRLETISQIEKKLGRPLTELIDDA